MQYLIFDFGDISLAVNKSIETNALGHFVGFNVRPIVMRVLRAEINMQPTPALVLGSMLLLSIGLEHMFCGLFRLTRIALQNCCGG